MFFQMFSLSFLTGLSVNTVVISLMDQETHRRNITDAFWPDPTCYSFKKPVHDAQIASGFPRFVPQAVAKNIWGTSYVIRQRWLPYKDYDYTIWHRDISQESVVLDTWLKYFRGSYWILICLKKQLRLLLLLTYVVKAWYKTTDCCTYLIQVKTVIISKSKNYL